MPVNNSEAIYHLRPTKGAAQAKGAFCIYGTNFEREYYNTHLECFVAINTIEHGDRNYEIRVHAGA